MDDVAVELPASERGANDGLGAQERRVRRAQLRPQHACLARLPRLARRCIAKRLLGGQMACLRLLQLRCEGVARRLQPRARVV